MSKRYSTEQFVEKVKLIHGDLYDYSLVEYINTSTKIIIICKIHGVFEQVPYYHISGCGCPICSKEKQKQTNLERYGVEYASQSKSFQEKVKKTNLERYGVERASQTKHCKEKVKKTNLERYGCESPTQNEKIQEKCRQTTLKNFGVEYPQQSDDILNKSKNTNLKKYGVERPAQNKKIQEKIKQTNLKKYGVERPTQSLSIIHKTKQTNLKKYGLNHKNQSHMVNILSLIEDKGWLFEQYVTLNKSTQQIAKELNVSSTTVNRYLNEHEIQIKYTVGYSMKCIQWLESIMEQEDIFIQHADNIGEYRIPGTRYKVDGYCEENNTIYEFHGDIFHGNPKLFEDHETPNFYNKNLTAKELYDSTIERETNIKELGYNLITIWENDFEQK